MKAGLPWCAECRWALLILAGREVAEWRHARRRGALVTVAQIIEAYG